MNSLGDDLKNWIEFKEILEKISWKIKLGTRVMRKNVVYELAGGGGSKTWWKRVETDEITVTTIFRNAETSGLNGLNGRPKLMSTNYICLSLPESRTKS